MKKILVIQTAFIGDAILITSLLESIHAAQPSWSIDLLVRKGNEQLFVEHPFIQNVLVWNKKESKYKSLVQLMKQVRSSSYDVVINVQRFGATGFLTAVSKAKLKIGFSKNPFSILFSHKVQHEIGNGSHEIERNIQLVKPLGEFRLQNPKLYPSDKQIQAAQQLVSSENYICVAPASVWFTKQYPIDKWISFIQKLPQNMLVVLLGAPSDKIACEKIKRACPDHTIQNLAGECDLLTSAAIMKHAQMNYVNDSAPMHLCSAMDAPVTALFCSTIPAFGFGPLSQQQFVIETNQQLDCRPCGLHGKKECPIGTFDCAYSISDEQLVYSLNSE